MTEILTAEDLARRWQCSEGRIRNVPNDQLPPKLQLPGSRLIRWRLRDVEAWEASCVQPPLDTTPSSDSPTASGKRRGPGRPRKTRRNA